MQTKETKKLSRSYISNEYDYKLGCTKRIRRVELLDGYTSLDYKKFIKTTINTSRKIKSSFYDLNLSMM